MIIGPQDLDAERPIALDDQREGMDETMAALYRKHCDLRVDSTTKHEQSLLHHLRMAFTLPTAHMYWEPRHPPPRTPLES
jgi:hypothetical protein